MLHEDLGTPGALPLHAQHDCLITSSRSAREIHYMNDGLNESLKGAELHLMPAS